jgi:CheY-like chemotaxis protein
MSNEEITVLLVDDDEDFLFQMKTFLVSRGYKVETAEGRAEAEALLGSVTPDVAVLDLMMDEMDAGFTLSHTIKNTFPEVPVILCTGVTSETGMKFDSSASWVKADATLSKPVRVEQLEREIDRLLSK